MIRPNPKLQLPPTLVSIVMSTYFFTINITGELLAYTLLDEINYYMIYSLLIYSLCKIRIRVVY